MGESIPMAWDGMVWIELGTHYSQEYFHIILQELIILIRTRTRGIRRIGRTTTAILKNIFLILFLTGKEEVEVE